MSFTSKPVLRAETLESKFAVTRTIDVVFGGVDVDETSILSMVPVTAPAASAL